MTQECKECEKAFVPNRPFQVFCNDRCKGAYHRRKYRQQAVEEAEERLAERMNGHGTPEQRKEASEAVASIIEGRQRSMVRRI